MNDLLEFHAYGSGGHKRQDDYMDCCNFYNFEKWIAEYERKLRKEKRYTKRMTRVSKRYDLQTSSIHNTIAQEKRRPWRDPVPESWKLLGYVSNHVRKTKSIPIDKEKDELVDKGLFFRCFFTK